MFKEEIAWIDLSEGETTGYKKVYSDVHPHFLRINNAAAVGNRLTKVMGLLQQLRLVCDHFSLLTPIAASNDISGDAIRTLTLPELRRELGNRMTHELSERLADSEYECPICMDMLDTPTLTSCKMPHLFCQECIIAACRACAGGDAAGRCPICRGKIRVSELISVSMVDPNAEAEAGPGSVQPADESALEALKGLPGSKITRLLQMINGMEAGSKAVVFTQFKGMMRQIADALKAKRIGHVELHGSMSQKQRARSLDSFRNNDSVRVFLLSTRAAGVGLNLTTASWCFLMEPSFNHALEAQAVGRVWRLGQSRPVRVVRFFTRRTVEELMHHELYAEGANKEQPKVELMVKLFEAQS